MGEVARENSEPSGATVLLVGKRTRRTTHAAVVVQTANNTTVGMRREKRDEKVAEAGTGFVVGSAAVVLAGQGVPAIMTL